MDLQKELTGQAQEELQLSPEKWQEAVTQITQETVAEPVITVETDKNRECGRYYGRIYCGYHRSNRDTGT